MICKEPFLCIGFGFAILQESWIFPELIERLHKSVIGLAKSFVSFFKKQQDRLYKSASLDTLVSFIIVDDNMVFSETVARLKMKNAFVMLHDSI